MSSPLQVGDAVSYGWKGFTKNVGQLIVIALVIVLVGWVIGALQWVFDSWLLSTVVGFAGWLVALLLALGLIRAALAVVDGRQPAAEMLFATEGYGQYVAAAIVAGIGVGLGMLLCVIPGLILAFMWQFFGYSIADGDTTDPIGALTRSWNLVKDNLGSLLVLALVLMLLNFVGALLCGIGLLVTLPVSAIAVAFAWRTVTGGRVAAQG